ncbi:MAG: phosphate ABC transporter substrate-binding protein PstS [Propionibacteriales bacterium]|nr:phosphate ABC transporter substrate-binding protein PstS [Propionibacteriales bacterium]
MNRSLRRVAVSGIAVLTLGLAVSACGSEDTTTLNGAGSSAQDSAMKAWRAGYQKSNDTVTVNYNPAGSGAGVEQFIGNSVDFAASDSALDADKGEIDKAKERCGGVNALEVPSYVSPIAVVFSLDGVTDLNLSASTIAKIFDLKITKWNDPAIAADNAGVTLPDLAITPVHRSDESGTTKNFTDYLSKVAPKDWTYKADKVWPTTEGEAAKGTSGVIAAIKSGSIGYADESQAGDLSQAKIKVGDAFVAPSAEGAAIALEASPVDDTRAEGDLAIKVDRETTVANAYPLFLVSYVIACPTYDSAKADLIKGFLSYVVSADGQTAAAGTAGSAPLPASLQTKAASIINTIAAK